MTSKECLLHWFHRLRHWSAMFAGTSYYHRPQEMGRMFVARQLNGYFNDLTGKTDWKGKIDHDGLPLSTLSNGKSIHFPILLCQKALGHWDMWLIHERADDRQQFLNIANWLEQTQDSMGGWDTWGPMGQSSQYRYSAMTQGQAISVMTRAYKVTKGAGFERACRAALELLRKPVQDGGVCCYEAQNVFLEEFPASRRDTVLNGWIFALFGVHDYLLQFTDEQIKTFYADTCASLTSHFPEYDAGFWSYYSSGSKRLASPFYHRLHLSQLKALKQIIDQPCVHLVQERWKRYEKNKFCKSWAVLVKGFQKLREPGEITIVE